MPEIKGTSFTAPPKTKPTLSQMSSKKVAPVTAPSPLHANPLHAPPTTPPRDVLADVEVPLTLIRPSNDPPTLVFDSGVVRVNLYKTENKPQPDVSVWLMTITNSSTARIDDVSLEITSSGTDKVKLSAPSSTKLSPFSPICPSSPIQQVVIATSGTSSLQYKLKFDKEEKSGTISLL